MKVWIKMKKKRQPISTRALKLVRAFTYRRKMNVSGVELKGLFKNVRVIKNNYALEFNYDT